MDRGWELCLNISIATERKIAKVKNATITLLQEVQFVFGSNAQVE